jgi:hypothetical protein
MKITLKKQFVISFILLLHIISYSVNAQSKKEQISILNYQLDSLKQNVLNGQIRSRELETQLSSVNKNLNEILRELTVTKKLLVKEDSLKTVFASELKNVTKKLLLSEEKSIQMNSIINSSKVEIDDLKKELNKRDSLISIYEKQSLLDKETKLLLTENHDSSLRNSNNDTKIYIESKFYSAKEIIGVPIKIGNLLVAQNDFPEVGSIEASSICQKLGSGWRLPSIDELKLIYNLAQKNNIGNFSANDSYWSSSTTIYNIYLDFSSGEESWGKVVERMPKTRAVKFISTLDEQTIGTTQNYLTSKEKSKFHTTSNLLSAKEIIGIPIRMGNILVAQNDFSELMNWEAANLACRSLGKGWRLPTISELNILYTNRNKIGGFVSNYYWSSYEFELIPSFAYFLNFAVGIQNVYNKGNTDYVRAVRTL